jgi:hypothetical protein
MILFLITQRMHLLQLLYCFYFSSNTEDQCGDAGKSRYAIVNSNSDNKLYMLCAAPAAFPQSKQAVCKSCAEFLTACLLNVRAKWVDYHVPRGARCSVTECKLFRHTCKQTSGPRNAP